MNFSRHRKANLLGHSLGGKAVMTFAISYPEKVEKLIVADIAPKAYPPHHQRELSKALQSVNFDEKIKTRRGKRFGSVHSEKICDSVLTKTCIGRKIKNSIGVLTSILWQKNTMISLPMP